MYSSIRLDHCDAFAQNPQVGTFESIFMYAQEKQRDDGETSQEECDYELKCVKVNEWVRECKNEWEREREMFSMEEYQEY